MRAEMECAAIEIKSRKRMRNLPQVANIMQTVATPELDSDDEDEAIHTDSEDNVCMYCPECNAQAYNSVNTTPSQVQTTCECCECTLAADRRSGCRCSHCDIEWCIECEHTLPNTPHPPPIAAIAHTTREDGILIDEIYVRESSRRRGIARAMVRHVARSNQNATHIYLVVRNRHKQQREAMAAYRSMGFTLVPKDHNAQYPLINISNNNKSRRIMRADTNTILDRTQESPRISMHTTGTAKDIDIRPEDIWEDLRDHHNSTIGDHVDPRRIILESDRLTLVTGIDALSTNEDSREEQGAPTNTAHTYPIPRPDLPSAIVILGTRHREEEETIVQTQVIARPLKTARATQIPPNILSIPRAQVVTRDARREMIDTMLSQGRTLPPKETIDRIHTHTDRDLEMMIATTEPQISRRANSEGAIKRTRSTEQNSDGSDATQKPAKRMNSTLASWDRLALARYQSQMEPDVT